MLVKTVLNRVEHFKSFVFIAVSFQLVYGSEALVVEINARANSRPECPECGRRGRKYDTMPECKIRGQPRTLLKEKTGSNLHC